MTNNTKPKSTFDPEIRIRNLILGAIIGWFASTQLGQDPELVSIAGALVTTLLDLGIYKIKVWWKNRNVE